MSRATDRSVKLAWVVAGMLWLAPQIALAALGGFWLVEHGWLWTFLAASAGAVAVAWAFLAWTRRAREQVRPLVDVAPSAVWPAAGDEAWRRVEAIADRVARDDLPLDRIEPWRAVVAEVIESVAATFHPNAREAVYETRIPEVLRVVELAARDVGRAFREHVPGAHLVTIGDLRRLQSLAPLGWRAYLLYRVAYFGLNPVAGVLRELRERMAGDLARRSIDDLRRRAIAYGVRRAGYYAIELYSGRLLVDEAAESFESRASRLDMARAAERDERLEQEPLRILVLGQVKAGKSSLINVMFGQVRTAVDVIPTTRDVEPFELVRDGLRRAIILDSPGYAGIDARGEMSHELREAIARSDLVLIVVSATSAARHADRQALDAVRVVFEDRRDRVAPPVLAVLTHIDLLRPAAEWNPPYDVAEPKTIKERHIADCASTVAADLNLPPADIVPTCLADGRVYNVDEALVPSILERLPRATRARYLRCLREVRDEQAWQQLWRQAVRAGRLLVETSFRVALDLDDAERHARTAQNDRV